MVELIFGPLEGMLINLKQFHAMQSLVVCNSNPTEELIFVFQRSNGIPSQDTSE